MKVVYLVLLVVACILALLQLSISGLWLLDFLSPLSLEMFAPSDSRLWELYKAYTGIVGVVVLIYCVALVLPD